MEFQLVPVNFLLGSKPLLTLLHLADMRVRLSEGLLLLLPLYGMILFLVLVHRPWKETSPPDALLVFTELALPAPLLSVDLAHVICHLVLPPRSVTTPPTPGAGVADTQVKGFNVLLPVTIRTKPLSTVFTLVRFDIIMSCLDMPGEILLCSELDSTCRALEISLIVMHRPKVPDHISLLPKPLPTLFTLVVHTFMDIPRVLV